MAARIYDKRVIIGSGFRAKTNYNYTKRQLDHLLQNTYDLEEFELTEQDSLNLTDK